MLLTSRLLGYRFDRDGFGRKKDIGRNSCPLHQMLETGSVHVVMGLLSSMISFDHNCHEL
jgi:hypothetical protein